MLIIPIPKTWPPTSQLLAAPRSSGTTPWQLKYADPFGDGTVIRVNLANQTDADRFAEAEAILKHRYPGVEWIIA